MDDNKIVEEIGNLSLSLANSSIISDEENDRNVLEEPNINRNDRDLHAIQSKRIELDSIQKDLDDLMSRLNSFIADSQEDISADEVSVNNTSLEEESTAVTEKQDGPPEKELKLSIEAAGDNLLNKIYVTDGLNPPEINWDAVGPILQKHVADLQRLHSLNQMTNAVVKRIRNVTQMNDTLLKNENAEKDKI